MGRYHFDGQNRLILRDYHHASPFSSFLPGIAGIDGIPLWVFYVNRGQGIISFGVENKNGCIMEFLPADKAYQAVSQKGFRTFIKLKDGAKERLIEPFCPSLAHKASESMIISPNKLELISEDSANGLNVTVSYFTLPNENLGALVRKVTIQNTGTGDKPLEVLDGLPTILPYGIDDSMYKTLGYTIKSWMDVFNLENSIPYYRVRASIIDSSEVSEVVRGHFYLSFDPEQPGQAIKPIVDADLIFGENTSLQFPDRFASSSLNDLIHTPQITVNKVPCGFTGIERTLEPGASCSIITLIGHASEAGIVNDSLGRLADGAYIASKMAEAEKLVEELTDNVSTKTASPLFDSYARQCYLDNLLRGGYPLLLENGRKPFVYHVFSRKHGDLERDYNFFSLAAECYSQGNGNFRDTIQNRRSDCLFNPDVGDFNLKMFMNLIQTDGYNPLVVKGVTFSITEEGLASVLSLLSEPLRGKVGALLKKPFTPGKIIKAVSDHSTCTRYAPKEFLTEVLKHSVQNMEADFGEGYWCDHWTYVMDLVDSYLALYPENAAKLLFEDHSYRYYDSYAFAAPRKDKFVLSNGKVRQYDAILESEAKREVIRSRERDPAWVRTGNGAGSVYETNLFEKLLCLAVNKFAALDPSGMGLEMEADKPGWDDSMNGLPGLFGSSMPESYELKRLLSFLAGHVNHEASLSVPNELHGLMMAVSRELGEHQSHGDDFRLWDRVYTAKEAYREKIQSGLSGKRVSLEPNQLSTLLTQFLAKLDRGLEKAEALGKGLTPTYFTFEAVDYELITDSQGQVKTNHKGRQNVAVKAFKPHVVAPFLEGVVRAMKVTQDGPKAREIYQKVKNSGLYDEKLKMYKICASLEEEPFETGRVKAFTPGWLENESIFTHMEYKYLLEILKSGLYDEFFEDMRHAMVPFLDPETYGRSTLENSSFIASSANPDPSVHGKGYVARLSGSTAEFLSMWFIMMTGGKPFQYQNKTLTLTLSPILPDWLFDVSGEVGFRFLGSCEVLYKNPARKSTFGPDGVSIRQMELTMNNGEKLSLNGCIIPPDYAVRIRNGEAASIICSLC